MARTPICGRRASGSAHDEWASSSDPQARDHEGQRCWRLASPADRLPAPELGRARRQDAPAFLCRGACFQEVRVIAPRGDVRSSTQPPTPAPRRSAAAAFWMRCGRERRRLCFVGLYPKLVAAWLPGSATHALAHRLGARPGPRHTSFRG